MSANQCEKYNGFNIQIEQNPVDQITGETYWKFQAWRIGEEPTNLISNGKQYGGYEVALNEAKKAIDQILFLR
ncbi:MAG: hypothetical protein V7L00_25705 [Nostoc sp.]|uniref:hypothetical protein n=1 Tax=Nostoc sp. TaxID=1180 RepID=UPI002FFAC8A6